MNKVLLISCILIGILCVITLYYWLFVGTGMTLKKGLICPQIISYATNPISGVTKTFGNPCRVPIGWRISNQR